MEYTAQQRALQDRFDTRRIADRINELLVRVEITQVFPNGPRYIHRFEQVERSHFVPSVQEEPPVPDWKKADWANDALPAGDPARRD